MGHRLKANIKRSTLSDANKTHGKVKNSLSQRHSIMSPYSKNSPGAGEPGRFSVLVPVLVAVVTFLVFLPALKNGFVNWDDPANLLDNFKYRSLGLEQLKWMFTTFHMGHYQPLSWVTYGLDYFVWGMAPSGYHLTSVLLHSVNAVLFYFLCFELFARVIGPEFRERPAELRLPAAFAALFFAIHPLRVEAVVWATDRRDVLSGLFYLLALLLYVRPRAAAGAQASWKRLHLLPLAAFILALLSKSVAVILPAVLIILDIYPLKRLPLDPRQWFLKVYRAVWLEKLPYFALSLIFSVVAYNAQAQLTDAGGLMFTRMTGLSYIAAQNLFSTGLYLWKTLVPLNLSPFYKFSGGMLTWQPLLAGSVILIITAVLVVRRRNWTAALAVWIYYLVALSPVSSILKLGKFAAADRYTYLPCMGFAVLAGWAFRAGGRYAGVSGRTARAMLALLVMAGLGLLTWRQERVWRDTETLWRYALSSNPEIEEVRVNLAKILADRGELDEAASHCREAVRINPDYGDARNDLGFILQKQGKLDEAIKEYRKVLRFSPGHTATLNNLGIALENQGKEDEAVELYREALRIDPDYADAHANLGYVLEDQGKLDEAVEHYREALRIDPDLAEIRATLGLALSKQDKLNKARYNGVSLSAADKASASHKLGLSLYKQGKVDEAVKYFRSALRIRPDMAEAHGDLGVALCGQGKTSECLEQYREALRLKPGLAVVQNNLGIALVSEGKFDEAVPHFEEALRIAPNYSRARMNLDAVLRSRQAAPAHPE